MLARKALAGTAGAPKVYVEDVFSTYLYTGNGSTQTITNNIDLSGKGGMVWCKARSQPYWHELVDTVRGIGSSGRVSSNATNAGMTGDVTGFTSSGFTLGYVSGNINESSSTNVSWTFRKAEKFFDVVTYTGNGGTSQTISHNLGSTPGCIIVKRTDTTTNWEVYHRSLGATKFIWLNSTSGEQTSSARWNDTSPTSTQFTVGSSDNVNANNGTYVAYLFAHDAGGFGDAGSDSIIKCGSFTTDGSGNATVDLGWEPQWLLLKFTDTTSNWFLTDNMRGLTVSGYRLLTANTSDAESSGTAWKINSTGFTYANAAQTNKTLIYIAIRRGPMKTPTTGTSVFNPVVYTGTAVDNRLIDTTIAPDMAMIRRRDSSTVDGMYVGTRLTSDEYLLTGTTDAAASDADSFMTPTSGVGNAFSAMNGVGVGVDATRQFNANTTSNNHVIHAFKRSPGFFDVVCYTGNATTNTDITHNLGVAPELIIVKRRNTADVWTVRAPSTTGELYLNYTNAQDSSFNYLGTSTSTTFRLLSSGTQVNGSGSTYVAYLFASLTGVSKIGTYTGNGSSTGPTVTTGFSPRYLLIKCTSTSGEWVVYDTARGLGSGNEPTILLATASAEYSGNYISPSSTGFQLVSNAGDINSNNQTYLYLAIA